MSFADKTYAPAIDRIVADHTLPDGYDRWAIKTTRPDLTTRNGFRWAFPGKVTKVPKAGIDYTNTGPCPGCEGDGLSVGLTYRGMASAGFPARTLLLVAVKDAHVLGGDADKLRVSRALTVELLDGEAVARADLGGADLWEADLRYADLRYAKLWGADLRGADLRYADLRYAKLWGANLRDANLRDADLRDADLREANLRYANLRDAKLWGADLWGADLRYAKLWDANLRDADLREANHNEYTVWPDGFDKSRLT